MMQRRQCSCHAPSGGQQIQQLVGRSNFKCRIEHSGRCVKELEIVRHFQSWGCFYKAGSCRRYRKKNQQRLVRENIGERQKKKRVLSTSLCRQLWLCHRHLGSSWSCSLLYQDLLRDRPKLLGLPSLLSALLHCGQRYIFRNPENLRNLRTFGLHALASETKVKTSIILLGHIAVSANLWANWNNNYSVSLCVTFGSMYIVIAIARFVDYNTHILFIVQPQ